MENLVKMREKLEELKRQLGRMPLGGYYDDRMDRRYLEIEISELKEYIEKTEKGKGK